MKPTKEQVTEALLEFPKLPWKFSKGWIATEFQPAYQDALNKLRALYGLKPVSFQMENVDVMARYLERKRGE